jgi:all-trans-retinol 13,14-reductase
LHSQIILEIAIECTCFKIANQYYYIIKHIVIFVCIEYFFKVYDIIGNVILNNQRRQLVVGSGISGMTMALLLAKQQLPVTLIEKTPQIGGAMRRFWRQGIPFDTGFHFTGGFDQGLGQMLKVLGIDDVVIEEPFRVHLYLAESKRKISLPTSGLSGVSEYLSQIYPDEAVAVNKFYAMEKEVMENTPMYDLRHGGDFGNLAMNHYDFITLKSFFDEYNVSKELRAVLGAASMCHGMLTSEVSVSSHCRINCGFSEHISRVRSGGDAFIDGFQREAKKLAVDIRAGVTVTECSEFDAAKNCHLVRLSDGSSINIDRAFWSIHPRAILASLPAERVTESFRQRIMNFEDSCGFFTIFGIIEPTLESFNSELTSCLSCHNLDNILLSTDGQYGMGVVLAEEVGKNGKRYQTLTAFATVLPGETAQWDKLDYHRDPDYLKYKDKKSAKLCAFLYEAYPELSGRFKLIESASMLTFKKYVPPTGCAYGIRQKIGTNNLWGRLPVRNFYAIGQSSLLPGTFGAMMSAFVLFRRLIGEDAFSSLIEAKLGDPL